MELIKDTNKNIFDKLTGHNNHVYIIAEIGSNFDGDLERAKKLALLSKDLGADAFKIQNFKAPKIVSDIGFKDMKVSFQSNWDKSVVEVYKKAEFPREWLKELSNYCDEIGIDFMSAPYDKEAVDLLEEIDMPIYKIGSGEVDNIEFLDYVARKDKPVILATGSATMQEVEQAVKTIKNAGNNNLVLLQCVTNYPSPVADSNLKAMVSMGKLFNVPVGYSDHTTGEKGRGDDPLNGITVPLGAVALGAIVIEKHFTDDINRIGPDHPFAMGIEDFGRMIKGIRAMEKALGDGEKKVMPSEAETVIIQRRGAYAIQNISKGSVLNREMIEFLRPAVGMRPVETLSSIGKIVKNDIAIGQPIKKEDVE